jgi:hypothetical protein
MCTFVHLRRNGGDQTKGNVLHRQDYQVLGLLAGAASLLMRNVHVASRQVMVGLYFGGIARDELT